MDFFEALKRRRSTRAFLPKPVEESKLQRILEAANSAPSAGDLQAYEIVVVKEGERKRALAAAALDQDFIAQAPVVLVFLANPPRSSRKYGDRGASLYSLQDATIAASYAWLAAVAQGLACAWVGAFYEDATRRILGAPKDLTPIAIIPVGYAGEEPEKTPRRPLKDLVHLEKI
ncbi:MAG: nitroreductase family protein [Candidatus Micrarchaeia archaeon]